MSNNKYLSASTNELLNKYISGFTYNSQKNYIGSVLECCNYCKKDFTEIETDDVRKYAFSMMVRSKSENKEEHISLTTIRNRLGNCRLFAQYIEENANIKDYKNPFDKKLEPAKNNDVRINDIPTYKELDELLKIAEKFDKTRGIYVIIAIVSRMAISSSSILKLKLRDISLNKDESFMIIRGSERKKDRTVAIPKDISDILDRYIKECPYDMTHSLFFNKRGKPLSLRMLDFYLENMQKDAGVKKLYCLRNIKDRAMIDMVSNGADIADVSRYTGIDIRRVELYRGIKLKKCPPELTHIKIVD